jgi:hypothetical protein
MSSDTLALFTVALGRDRAFQAITIVNWERNGSPFLILLDAFDTVMPAVPDIRFGTEVVWITKFG